jgi:hypothetical protein
MTAESFRNKIKRIYKIDDITNYVISFMFIGIGLYFLSKIVRNNLPTYDTPEKYTILFLPMIPIAVALYALWRIPKDYIVHQINSTKPMEEKVEVVEHYLSEVKVVWKSIEGNYRSYRYRNRLFTKVDVRFYIDENKVFFNVQGADFSALKGIIDFGLTRRATKRLNQYLQTYL